MLRLLALMNVRSHLSLDAQLGLTDEVKCARPLSLDRRLSSFDDAVRQGPLDY